MTLDELDLVVNEAPAAGAGLRERNRRDKVARILDAATVAFGRNGYDGARVEDIAHLAAVSPGTIYGYFSTKENVLLALVLRQRHVGRRQRRPYFATPTEDPIEAVCAFERSVIESSLRAFDVKLWRHVEASWLLQDKDGMGKVVGENEELIVEERTILLDTLRSRGALPRDMDIGEIADILHAINLHHWIRLLAGKHESAERAIESNCSQSAGLMKVAITGSISLKN